MQANLSLLLVHMPWADPESFFRGGPTFFLVNDRIQIPLNWAIIGPLAKVIWIAFCWHADDGLTLNADLVALWFFRGSGPVLLRNPIFLSFFSGGPDPLSPPPPPLWIRTCMPTCTLCWIPAHFLFQQIFHLVPRSFTQCRPRGYKAFFMLNSTEHEIATAHKN